MSTNETHICYSPTLPESRIPELYFSPKAAVLAGSKWPDFTQITVRFLEGSPALQERVRRVAREWERYVNLTLDFTDQAPTDIRIAFQPGAGSWSYLGTDCRGIDEPHPTMNYGWLDDASPDDELRRVVLHEFGHALGLIHEHQNPKGGIKWNRAAVIADLSGPPNDWDEETIENNMFRRYNGVISSSVDRASIMMYPIPASWTIDGFSADLNGELSQADKDLIGEVYPK